jgi:hypothetical protein
MELLKKYIEADPYGALFGRRLDTFHHPERSDASNNGFLQSFFRSTKPAKIRSTKADNSQTKYDSNHAGRHYDPISGRMVSIPPPTGSAPNDVEGKLNTEKAVDCPPGAEVEAKFASGTRLTEDGQFQPGVMRLNPEVQSSSQSVVDCPPGSEVETLFTHSPTTFKDAQASVKGPWETKYKPNLKAECPSESQLESLPVSESISATHPEPCTFKVDETGNGVKTDAGLTAGTNVECSPASELEAKFVSDPARGHFQSSPPGLENHQPTKQVGASVDCPPGNELDVNFSSEHASLDHGLDTSVQQEGTAIDQNKSQECFECSLGYDLGAQIISESANKDGLKSEGHVPVDCPPGSELEAKLLFNKASVEQGDLQPMMTSSLDNPPETSAAIDCTPGNELEAKFISDGASSQHPNENDDLDILDASEIRARYASSESETQPRPLDFDTPEDRVSESALHNQKVGPEHVENPSIPRKSFPKYHILAFDPSTSQVSTAEADSFFGVDEITRPIEVLSQLHNPAKFLPYFEKMQQEGYEIATGGGNILVFRKVQSTGHHTLPSGIAHSDIATDQDPAIQAEIAKHLRHDSINSSQEPGASNLSTTEVSRQ